MKGDLLNCLNCNKPFVADRKNAKFCGVECKINYHSLARPSRKQYFGIKNCLFCNKEFSPARQKSMFCSRKCKDTYRNRNKPSVATKRFGISRLKANELKNNQLSNKELQVIYGGLLGDGSITKTQHGYRFSLCQCEKQFLYLLWKKSMLPNLMLAHPVRYEGRFGEYATVQYHLHSIHHPQLETIYNLFYINGKKTVSNKVLELLQPLGIAVWYMDDGSYNRNINSKQINWATDSFSKEENELIINWFKNEHDIEIKLQNSKGKYWRLRINRTETSKFFSLVRDYIHPTMLYKIE